MANKVSNFSDLIHRVAASCLLHPLARGHESAKKTEDGEEGEEVEEEEDETEEEEEERKSCNVIARLGEVESLMCEVFEAVSEVKRAYVSLQEAHCPWDSEKMRLADVAVIAELRRLGRLRERFRRKGGRGAVAPLREAVAPYEAALEELKREVRAKEMEIDGLKEKLAKTNSGKRGRLHSQKRVSCSLVAAAPTPELFEMCMNHVKETSKSFTALLLSLMRSAHWDIAAAVRSIEGSPDGYPAAVGSHHAKHALESYVSRKIFQGFENETFYIDGSLSSLINPDKFRRDCYTQFRDMKAMDPSQLLGILPTCHFGKFCGKKFLSIVHPKMEESFFGDLELRRLVLAGNHPRNQFYGEFLGLAKAVWLLHLLAFALEPPPCHFQATRGADFHPDYMESVIKFNGCSRVPSTQVVGFSVSPGFKLFNGWVIKARVYLVPQNVSQPATDNGYIL